MEKKTVMTKEFRKAKAVILQGVKVEQFQREALIRKAKVVRNLKVPLMRTM